jgi:kynurenine 3-monooxygenase
LNAFLLDAAESTGRVKVHFKHKLEDAEPEKGELRFETPKGRETLTFARVFGADGSASALRNAMSARKGVKPSEVLLDAGYKELIIAPERSEGLELNALHIWPRHAFMLIALPNKDRSYTCTLFLSFKGKESFEALSDRAAVRAFFEKQFPDVMKRIPDLEEQFFANPTGKMVTIKTAPWNGGERSLLIGDAAHAIVPFFGQGMNCGFEDCVLLDEGIGSVLEGKETWSKLFDRFGRERKPDSDAIADMAVENFIEMRDLVADPQFLMEKAVERILSREFADQYVSRYQLVTFSRVPYSRAYAAGIAQSKILKELCAGLKRAEDVDLKLARKLIARAAAGLLPAAS